MSLTKYQTELEYCLQQASDLLGGRALPLSIEWDLGQLIGRLLKLETRVGLGRQPAMMCLHDGRRGHYLEVGLERYRWDTDEGTVQIAKVLLPYRGSVLADFWAVRQIDYRQFYRFVRRATRDRSCVEPPVMPDDQRQRLWDNTVGFLRGGQEEMARYGVWPKRGVLLLGEPGNGKTMACRWLAAECRRRGLCWKRPRSSW